MTSDVERPAAGRPNATRSPYPCLGERAVRAAATLLTLIGMAAVAATASAADFDRTVAVTRGLRLDVRLFGGDIVVHSWDRDAVRVQATHFRTDVIDVRTARQIVSVTARSLRGTQHGIDIDIQVPSWMPVVIAGTYLNITVEGTRAAVQARTVRGDVTVRGGADALHLESVEGDVTLEDARGRADLTAVNNAIRVTRLVGDLVADAVNGAITLEDVTARSVEASTIAGDISWDGAIADGGRYQFATHSGDVDVSLRENPNVTVSARAFEGLVRSTLPLSSPPTGRKTRIVLGAGTSSLDIETFSGTISLRGGAGTRSRRP